MRTLPVLTLALVFSGCKKDDGSDSTTSTGTPTGSTAATWVFSTDAPDTFTRIDRVGMPAVATATITSKDAYNAADPADDAAGMFVTEITDNLTALHAALDDDLTGLTLTPCAVNDCVAQAAPLVVPDTLKIDTSVAAGFPNGRLLEDPVIDVTLAVVLLDLTVHGVTDLVGVNPTANDVPFRSEFPWLADPIE